MVTADYLMRIICVPDPEELHPVHVVRIVRRLRLSYRLSVANTTMPGQGSGTKNGILTDGMRNNGDRRTGMAAATAD